MPWCPQCGEEYLEELNQCSDCGVGLVSELPEAWEEEEHLWNPEPKLPPASPPVLDKNLPQTTCVLCGEGFDFDYPQCPFCGQVTTDVFERVVPPEEEGVNP